LMRASLRFHDMELAGITLTCTDEQLWADITAALTQ
jgi:hypothetical protein